MFDQSIVFASNLADTITMADNTDHWEDGQVANPPTTTSSDNSSILTTEPAAAAEDNTVSDGVLTGDDAQTEQGTTGEAIAPTGESSIPADNTPAEETTIPQVTASAEESTLAEDTTVTDDTTEQDRPTEQELADHELALLLAAQEEHGYEDIPDEGVPPEIRECVCGETYTDISQTVILNCGCVRCVECLNENIRVGLESKANFPPKCCLSIDVNDIAGYLQETVLARWDEVRAEYTDISLVYCANNQCSRYLGKETFIDDNKWAICTACNVTTCPACLHLGSEHLANTCPERLEKMDKALMEENKWKQCPQCKNMIEKVEGCDHMECECGQQFCYQCGRSYTGGMPCNCGGQNNWVEEDEGEDDPAIQQEIMDRLAAGQDEHLAEDNPVHGAPQMGFQAWDNVNGVDNNEPNDAEAEVDDSDDEATDQEDEDGDGIPPSVVQTERGVDEVPVEELSLSEAAVGVQAGLPDAASGW